MNPPRRHLDSLLLAAVLFLLGSGAEAAGPGQAPALEPEASTFAGEGIEVKFALQPLAAAKEHGATVREGEDASVRFALTDTATGSPVKGLRPAAWMSLRRGGQAADPTACREKIQSFLQGSLAARPDADLNAYYLLALNQEASISVIDPLLGYGASKLLALIPLNAPGADWALSSDRKRLFVTLPSSRQVAVVDTAAAEVEVDSAVAEEIEISNINSLSNKN